MTLVGEDINLLISYACSLADYIHAVIIHISLFSLTIHSLLAILNFLEAGAI